MLLSGDVNAFGIVSLLGGIAEDSANRSMEHV
jgi:hypothetical protein